MFLFASLDFEDQTDLGNAACPQDSYSEMEDEDLEDMLQQENQDGHMVWTG